MKLRELAVIAGAAVLMHACSGRDDDVRPVEAPMGADSAADSAPQVPPAPDTLSPARSDTVPRVAPVPRRPPRDSAVRDSNAGAPPDRNPPVGDPAPIPRPPVRLPRGDST